jgi:hypothetical protein
MKKAASLRLVKNIVPWPIRYRLMELRGRSLYSGYADAHRCIFVHIPKTAGTSIARALFNAGSRHVPCIEYERANPRKFRRYFKFAIVRNPWDRLFSAYRFLKQGGMNDNDRAWANAHLARYGDFEQFVHEWVNETNVRTWVHFRPQGDFITDAAGNMAMDLLGRFEHIDADYESICQRIGMCAPLPRSDHVAKVHFSTVYSAEMVEIVRVAYKEDIDLLDYSFSNT